MGDTSTRTLTARTGDVYNLADHGADGTALGANGNAGDNAALNKAIAYATLHPGTLIYLPQNINGQPWQFTASSLFTFNFPSNTTFAGAGINATTIAWNDANTGNLPAGQACTASYTCGYYLFGSSYNSPSNTTGVRPSNLIFQDFKIVGTWGPNGTYVANTIALFPGNVDGLTIRNVESDYSRGFGMGTGYSTNVLFDGDVVNTSYADGISAQGTSQLEMVNLKISHVSDDCLSAHEEQGVPETVRRDILIGNVQCFDTTAIHVEAPLHLSINNVLMSSPKGGALVIEDQGVGGSAEGSSAVAGVAVSNFLVLNPVARSAIDNYYGGDIAISVGFAPARAGTTTPPTLQSGNIDPNAAPGFGTAGQGYIRNPYPEWMVNSNNASVAMNGAMQVNFENIAVIRTFPGADGNLQDGSDIRFPNFASLGQGNPIGAFAPVMPTPKESDLRVQCFNINGGYIHGMSIHNLTCSGQNTGLIVSDSGNVSHMDDIVLDGGHFFDLASGGVYSTLSNAASTLQMIVRNSDFDMDPFDRAPFREPGPQTSVGISSLSWANGVVTVTTASAPSPALITGQTAQISGVTVATTNPASPGYNTNGGSVPITVTGSTTFTYPAATNPGTVTSTSGMIATVPTPPPYATGTMGAVFGGWQFADLSYCGYVAFCQSTNTGAGGTPLPVQGGILAMNNTVKNASADTNVDTTSTVSGWTFRNNYDFGQITVPNGFSTSNLGVGKTSPGFEIVNMDSNPNDAAYGLITSVKPAGAPSEPTTGTWAQGDYVKNIAESPSNPIVGWLRLTNGTGNQSGIDWQPNLVIIPTAPTVVQSVSARSVDTNTSETLTFPNNANAANTDVILLVGGGGGNGSFNPVAPATCTEIAGPAMAGYGAATNQHYEAWKCPAATTQTFKGLDDGTLFLGEEVSNFTAAAITASYVNATGSGNTLNIPVSGAPNDIRMGVLEWDSAGSTSTTVSPTTVATTNFPPDTANTSDAYHYGMTYSVPIGLTGSFTATPSYGVTYPTYVQVDLLN